MATRWRVVYTKHKVQKRKVWQDGFLEVILFADEDGQPSKSAIDEMFFGTNRTVESGSVIELPGFLVDPDNIIGEPIDLQLPVVSTENVNPHLRSCTTKAKSSSKKFRLGHRQDNLPNRVTQLGPSIIVNRRPQMTPFLKRQHFKRPKGHNPVFLGVKSCLLQLSDLKSTNNSPISACNLSIPNTFSNSNEYIASFQSALVLEINAVLYEAASMFCYQYWRITNVLDSPFRDIHDRYGLWPRCIQHSTLCIPRDAVSQILYCPLRQCSFQYPKGTIPAKLQSVSNIAIPVSAYHKRASYFQKTGLLYYASCQLIRQFPKQPGSNVVIRDENKMRLFLKLPDKRAPSSSFALYDCWIVSNSPSFESEESKFWILITYAKYHGPSKSGMLELKTLPGMKAVAAIKSQGSHENLFAMMVGNIQSEVIMMLHLESLRSNNPGDFFRCIQDPSQSSFVQPAYLNQQLSLEQVMEHFNAICQEFHLNLDQKAVLHRVRTWVDPDSGQSEPIVLVHGVFGTGKSHLLAAIVTFLCRVFTDSPENSHRILIASLTNVAVDRILLGLKEHGFTDFARVGSVKKIAKPILKHVLHWNENSSDQEDNDKTALATYREMLNDPEITGPDRAYVSEAYDELLAHRTQQRAERLKNMVVVGVTCASSVVDVLSGTQFSVVLLDECSQMTEPMSLLPLTNFKARFSILVGDPMQLPPTLRSTSNLSSMDLAGLKRTLFVRLQHAGICPIMLTQQYRCHPILSRVCNELFYNNRLQDGCLASDRGAIIPGLSPLAFIDLSKISSQCITPGGSFYNPVEVSVVCQILTQIVSSIDVENFTIGVITLYKSQEHQLKTAVSNIDCNAYAKIQISTVDAFQGSEKEIIILSTVRSSGIGFINCPYRLNVALSRAKRHMIIVGSSPPLLSDHLWRNVIQYAKWVAGQSPPFHFDKLPEIQRDTASNSFSFAKPISLSSTCDDKQVDNTTQSSSPRNDYPKPSSLATSDQSNVSTVQHHLTFDYQEKDSWSWVNDVQIDNQSGQQTNKDKQKSDSLTKITADDDVDLMFAL